MRSTNLGHKMVSQPAIAEILKFCIRHRYSTNHEYLDPTVNLLTAPISKITNLNLRTVNPYDPFQKHHYLILEN